MKKISLLFFTLLAATFVKAQDVSGVFADNGSVNIVEGITDATASAIRVSGNHTMEAWVKAANTERGYVMSMGTANSFRGAYRIETVPTSGKAIVAYAPAVSGTDFFNVTTTAVICDGTWHHIAVVGTTSLGTTSTKIYVDGVLDATTVPNYTRPTTWTNAAGMGGTMQYSSVGGRGTNTTTDVYFNGEIDEARFWTVARTQTQIQQQSCVITDATGLYRNIKLDSNINDSSINAKPTTAVGSGVSSYSTGNCAPIWTGTTNTTWSDASNWRLRALPNQNSDVTIPSVANQPIIVSNVTVNSLAIASGATLNVNEGNVLNISGTITNSGDLILKSSVTGTASLLNTSAAPNVTQQRYLSSNQRGWRLLSNPLTSTTFNALASASSITIGTNFTGEYLSASNTWTSTDGSVSMDNQKAYKVFITGLTGEAPTYTSGPSNVTLVNKGTAANTVPAAIAATSGEFYLIANPYTAPISLKTILDANIFLSQTVSYYDPTVGSTDVKVKFGGYTTKDTSTSAAPGDANDVVIPPMGALFVQASSAGSISVPKTAIFTGTNNSGTYTHKTAQTKVASTNALKIEVSSSGVYYDALALQFKAVGDTGSNIDFGKLPNSILDAYSFVGSNKMAVSELELAVQTIALGITCTIAKNYTFKVIENSIPAGYEAVLVDNVLNTSTVLTAGTSYNFAIDSNPASQGDSRFAINLKTAGTLGVIANELDASIQVYPNPSRGQFNITNSLNQKEGATIEISNLNGQVIHSQKSNPGTTTTIQTKDWASGVYILKASNNGTQTTKKLIIQ